MSWLSTVGKVLAEGIAVVTGLEPLIPGLFGSKAGSVSNSAGTVINDLSAIGGVVTQVEAIIQTKGSGAVKLQAAAPLVANIIKTSELVSGKTIKNETLFIQGCADLTNAVAEILNSLDEGSIKTTGKVITTVPKTTTVPIQWTNNLTKS